MKNVDVLIIGASASGLMCAIEAGKHGRKVMILDHADKVGKKILISGGGRCNFTNYNISADNYLSQNPHFCKSALSRFQYYDFLALLAEYEISWHEKTLGQLFCDHSAGDILHMLLTECEKHGVNIQLNCSIHSVQLLGGFQLDTSKGHYHAHSLVIASGGLSVKKMGASDFGLRLAHQFGINIIPTRPGLVPLTYSKKDSQCFKVLAGISIEAEISFKNHIFKENLLFTHRGMSGPAVLQISSYWQAGDPVMINVLPGLNLYAWLLEQKKVKANSQVKNVLSQLLPKRFVDRMCEINKIALPLKQYNDEQLKHIAGCFQLWAFCPSGTEGYRVAEVTVGGVDTDTLSSKTMQSKSVDGLFFIGEVVDVTGHLGGYNFQWAWSSGYCAGQYA
jgi:predicted Rossmann fold flavoprotein